MKNMTRSLMLLFLCTSLIGCGSDSQPSKEEKQAQACKEPENPYSQGSGHYAGFEWAAEHGRSCNGNSQSFNEGCGEYEHQEAEYEECEHNR